MTPWWKKFQKMTENAFSNNESKIYNDFLSLAKAIDKLNLNKDEITLPSEWENLRSNIIFYNQFRNSKSSLTSMNEYLENALKDCEYLRTHFATTTYFNHQSINNSLTQLSSTIEKELSKLRKNKKLK